MTDGFIESILAGQLPVTQTASGLLLVPMSMVVATNAALGLHVPATAAAFEMSNNPSGFMRYVHERMTADHYFDPPTDDEERRRAVVALLAICDREDLIGALGYITLCLSHEDWITDLASRYHSFLEATKNNKAAYRFNEAFKTVGARGFIARQSLLAAFRLALTVPEAPTTPAGIPTEFIAVMLCHQLAAMSDRAMDPTPATGDLIGGVPADLAIEMVRNQTFYATEDLLSLMDRTVRLFRDYGPRVTERFNGRSPVDLLVEATGLEPEDFIALGFALVAHANGWTLGGHLQLADHFRSDMDEAKKAAFLDAITNDRNGFQSVFQSQTDSDWNFLEFQTHPVLHIGDGLLILDHVGLMLRFTNGLYWIIETHLDSTEGRIATDAWRNTWGDMIELLAEDELRPQAPVAIDRSPTFFTEEDLKQAYPNSQRCDVVIDYGSGFGLFEVVSGQLATRTRIQGVMQNFKSDMEKLALKKIRQLSATADCIIADEAKLTGHVPPQQRPIQPVIIAGGGFPVTPPTLRYIKEWCVDNEFSQEFLQQDRVRKLAIIELSELEVLEAFSANGHDPLQIIDDWQQSDIDELSLRNYLYETFPYDAELYRPERMKAQRDAIYAETIARLKLRDADDQPG